jgi:hypothetical protein
MTLLSIKDGPWIFPYGYCVYCVGKCHIDYWRVGDAGYFLSEIFNFHNFPKTNKLEIKASGYLKINQSNRIQLGKINCTKNPSLFDISISILDFLA